jgi:hypothetical protein
MELGQLVLPQPKLNQCFDMNNESFKVRAYGFCELAQLYFPNITKKSASAQLRRWIKLSETVLPMLKNLGYKPGTRLLTPVQVKVIIDEFGEP